MIISATKKPVTIEAVQLTRKNIKEVYEFINGDVSINSLPASDRWEQYEDIVKAKGLDIMTLESDGQTQIADMDDFIIKGVQGEFYPCKPDIFHATYNIINKPISGCNRPKSKVMSWNG